MNTEELDANFRHLAENLPGCFALVSSDETFRLVNTRYAHLLGKEPHEIVGRTLREVLGPTYERAMPRFQRVLSGQPGSDEVAGTMPDGSRMWLKIAEAPHFDGDGNIDGFYLFVTDVSAHHEAQEQLRRQSETLSYAQRRSTAAELATAWAHDVTQPLNAITNFMQAAARRISAGSADRVKLQELLAHTAAEIRRAGATIQRVRGSSSPPEPTPVRVDLRSIVRSTVELIRTHVDSPGLRVELDLDASDLWVRCDPIRTQQICLDLLQNALDAMVARMRRVRSTSARREPTTASTKSSSATRDPGSSPTTRVSSSNRSSRRKQGDSVSVFP